MAMKKQFTGLGKDIFVYGFMAGISQLTGFLLLPLFTRVFSTDEYGIIDIIATLTMLVSTLARLALPSAIFRYFFDIEDYKDRNSLVSTLFVFTAVLGLAIMLLGFLLSESLAELLLDNPQYGPFIALGFLSAVLSSLTKIPEAVLRMERRIVPYNMLGIIYSLLYAGIALYLVFGLSSGVLGVFLASVSAGVVQLLLATALIWRSITRHLSYSYLSRSLKYSLPLLPTAFVNVFNNQVDRWILLTYVGLSGVGIFGVAAKIGLAVKLLTNIFQQAWMPYAMTQIKSPKKERNQFYQRVLRYYTGGFAILGLTLTAISSEIFRVLVPDEYYSGFVVMPWVMGAAILHVSASITGLGVSISEKTHIYSIAAWTGLLLNMILALTLIPAFGIWGAAIGTFLAELVFTTILWYFTERITDIRYHSRQLILVLVTYVITAVLLIWVSEQISLLLSLSIKLGLLTGACLIIASLTIEKPTLRRLRELIANFHYRADGGI